jgi:hypothetical protein
VNCLAALDENKAVGARALALCPPSIPRVGNEQGSVKNRIKSDLAGDNAGAAAKHLVRHNRHHPGPTGNGSILGRSSLKNHLTRFSSFFAPF